MQAEVCSGVDGRSLAEEPDSRRRSQTQTIAMTETLLSRPLAAWHVFMRRPETISHPLHAELTLRQGNFEFAAQTQLIPILFSEIPAAAATHPIVVVTDPAPGLAVLVGLEPGSNLVVREGRWLRECYVPMIARLYPFAPAAVLGESGTIPLLADLAADHLSVGGEGQRLFNDDRPGPALTQQLKGAHMILRDMAATRDFARALIERGIAADPTPAPRGAPSLMPRCTGVLQLDARALGGLPDASVIEWHRRGWSAAVVLMLHAERHAMVLAALQRSDLARVPADESGFAPSAIV